MTKIFGITGGMGSGKSTLSRNLTKKGFRVHDSDKEVSNIYKKPSKSFIAFICPVLIIILLNTIIDTQSKNDKFEDHQDEENVTYHL